MTPLQLAEYIRFRTRTDSNTFTDTQIISLSRFHMDMLATEVIEANVGGEDYFGMPMSFNLVATNGDFAKREYPLSPDVLNKILRIEAYLGGKWVKLTPFDLSSYGRPVTEENVLQDFSNNEASNTNILTGSISGKRGAYYDTYRNSIWIYSGAIDAYSAGLKVWTYTWPAHLTNLSSTTDMSIDPSTTQNGFPRALHPILADLIIIDYKQSREKPIPLTEDEQNIETRKRKAIASLKRMNKDEELIPNEPPAEDYFNNGLDL